MGENLDHIRVSEKTPMQQNSEPAPALGLMCITSLIPEEDTGTHILTGQASQGHTESNDRAGLYPHGGEL